METFNLNTPPQQQPPLCWKRHLSGSALPGSPTGVPKVYTASELSLIRHRRVGPHLSGGQLLGKAASVCNFSSRKRLKTILGLTC